MSGFEFFFSLYDLVLGLSVVEIVSGAARLMHDRAGVRVGWLVPLLATLMLLDLASFWLSAYKFLQSMPASYASLVVELAVSALYYVAASAVFPRDFAAEPDFDAWYLRRRRLVIGIMLLAGLLAFELLPSITPAGRAARLAYWTSSAIWQPLLFYACVAGIMISRDKRVNAVILLVLIAPYAINFVMGFR